jgi:hypothetical protein
MAARTRILVACEELVLAGGMLRFERLGCALPQDRYELAYVCLADQPVAQWASRFPVLKFQECSMQSWDFVMVPGSGFSSQTIDRLAWFCAPRFGRRVQHVLNDQSVKPRFLHVNKTFQPHLVVFNNLAWPPGSYTEFQAERFHTVLGAVDIDRFRPTGARTNSLTGQIVLGGLANKNAEVLIDALAWLPERVKVKLLGNPAAILQSRPHIAQSPRVELTGVLFDDALPGFYRDIDIAVHTEMRGGWSNFAAEAMASGVPLICTPHGTAAFARDGETAIVLGETTAPAVSAAVARLVSAPDLGAVLALKARRTIEGDSWQTYAQQLFEVIRAESFAHYTHAPEFGLFGKWTPEQRLQGLQGLFTEVKGATVLDVGAAEGLLAQACLQRGAKMVVGLECTQGRVASAAQICRDWANGHFEQADITDLPAIRRTLMRYANAFDVVLYLGVHHHLAPQVRTSVLDLVMKLATKILAVRMPECVYTRERVQERLRLNGFSEEGEALREPVRQDPGSVGTVHVWRRNGA